MRHAKSSWDDTALSDIERPLNDRGKRAAPFMGRFLDKYGLKPDLIVSSPAVRARATAELAAEAMGYTGDVVFDAQIYEASPNKLVRAVRNIPGEHGTAMLIGHNPGLESLIYRLAGVLEPMPTAAVAVIELDIENWADADAGTGKLVNIFRPRDLMK